jgi:hypothetical protein
MKKFLTLLFTVMVASALAVPASAKLFHRNKKQNAESSEQGKAHKKHSKKKGATEGMKTGQEGTNQ